jgi:hypothetical protein
MSDYVYEAIPHGHCEPDNRNSFISNPSLGRTTTGTCFPRLMNRNLASVAPEAGVIKHFSTTAPCPEAAPSLFPNLLPTPRIWRIGSCRCRPGLAPETFPRLEEEKIERFAPSRGVRIAPRRCIQKSVL